MDFTTVDPHPGTEAFDDTPAPEPVNALSQLAHVTKTALKRQRDVDSGVRSEDGSFRPAGFGNFGVYMEQKRQKMREQDDEQQFERESVPQLFAGMVIHINGFVEELGQQALKTLVLKHGAKYDHYLSKTTTTHIIASNLTEAKKVEFRAYRVASPKWVLDSVEQGRLLPWHDYSVLATGATNGGIARALDSKEPEFIQQYYQNSRLHFLSTWKAELQEMTRPFQEARAGAPVPPSEHRVIFHVDMDCFFVSVSLLARPDLIRKPVGISHATNVRSGSSADLASVNYVARSFGVKNGMSVGKAKSMCPDLVLLPYDFDRYRATTAKLYEVFMRYADNLQAISCDEAYLDVSSRIKSPATDILPLAHEIRREIHAATGGCDASIGAGENMLLARLATRKAKPNNAYFWTRREFLEELKDLAVGDLPGIGRNTEKRFREMGVATALDLYRVPKERLAREFGAKVGQSMYDACRGIDNRQFGHKPRQTVSAEVNYGIRFANVEQAHTFLRNLSNEVADRLKQLSCTASHITLKLMTRATDAPPVKHMGHGICDSHSKSTTLPNGLSTDNKADIAAAVIQLLDSFGFDPADLRGIGISCTRLSGPGATDADSGPRPGAGPSILDFVKRAEAKAAAKAAAADAGVGQLPPPPSPPPVPMPPPSLNPDNIDWAVFQTLPAAIQAECTRALEARERERGGAAGGAGTAAGPLHPLLPRGGSAKLKAAELKEQVEALLQQELDGEFLAALPEDIRNEVINDKRVEIRQRLRAAQAPPPRPAPTRATPAATRHRPVFPAQNSPALLGRRDLPQVRQILRDWIHHVAAHATVADLTTDAEFVRTYVVALVESRFLDRAVAIMKYLVFASRQFTDLAAVHDAVDAVVEAGKVKAREVYDSEPAALSAFLSRIGPPKTLADWRAAEVACHTLIDDADRQLVHLSACVSANVAERGQLLDMLVHVAVSRHQLYGTRKLIESNIAARLAPDVSDILDGLLADEQPQPDSGVSTMAAAAEPASDSASNPSLAGTSTAPPGSSAMPSSQILESLDDASGMSVDVAPRVERAPVEVIDVPDDTPVPSRAASPPPTLSADDAIDPTLPYGPPPPSTRTIFPGLKLRTPAPSKPPSTRAAAAPATVASPSSLATLRPACSHIGCRYCTAVTHVVSPSKSSRQNPPPPQQPVDCPMLRDPRDLSDRILGCLRQFPRSPTFEAACKGATEGVLVGLALRLAGKIEELGARCSNSRVALIGLDELVRLPPGRGREKQLARLFDLLRVGQKRTKHSRQ
ncbi:deoxycytidyl transferase [Blastocladiella emersonii ATCC 22665]|nr:deoxycytidyl transferase [Blastocladiella emersonii ATCC 22665]